MKIAFIHYHLKKGGVTTVIRHQVEAVNALGWETLVLSGAPAEENFPTSVATIPELGYDNTLKNIPYSSEIIAKKIITSIHAHWPQGADVVHVHNPTLKKNHCLQNALNLLQHKGLKLLCQIHDFAEDGRPAAYYDLPYVKNCHYAVINQRDHQLLIQSGLRSYGCHLLANTVMPMDLDESISVQQKVVVYPVRAIRRKNIGEALLISLFFDHDVMLAITLPPNSPADYNSYDQWRSFSTQHNLAVQFEAGAHWNFAALMAQCQYVLTTSITEGFGFAFLEPWISRKPLWGRSIPNVCQGFMAQGIHLEHLYTRLAVPLRWIDLYAFEHKWKNAMLDATNKLDCPMTEGEVDEAWRFVSMDGNIDFGLLAEIDQQQVIHKVIEDPQAAERLKQLNPFLNPPGPPADIEKVIHHNQSTIAQLYHPDRYVMRLKKIYNLVVTTPVLQRINKRKLASAFIKPNDFSMLKWGER